jgi:hypothetical protein
MQGVGQPPPGLNPASETSDEVLDLILASLACGPSSINKSRPPLGIARSRTWCIFGLEQGELESDDVFVVSFERAVCDGQNIILASQAILRVEVLVPEKFAWPRSGVRPFQLLMHAPLQGTDIRADWGDGVGAHSFVAMKGRSDWRSCLEHQAIRQVVR